MANLLKEHVQVNISSNIYLYLSTHIYTYLHISTQAQLGDSYPCLVLPALHIIIETLNLHVISAAWDVQVSSLQI